MNTSASWPDLVEAESRVLKIQTKLHQWAIDNGDRCFDDLHNLVCDPAFLLVGWHRMLGNRGGRSAGVVAVAPRSIDAAGELRFLTELRDDLRSGRFRPLPVRQRMIPKANGKLRSLGIPTARDRVVQASMKLVLEPIFEAGFRPCSYGFGPRRRPHDAIAEIHMMATQGYTWVLECDITACFDEISHPALLARVRERIGDRRVVRLLKAFLCAGVLSEDGVRRDTKMGTPQGGILSPLLANIAMSVLDDHFAEAWESFGHNSQARCYRRHKGLATYRLVRYADDFVVMVQGTRSDAEQLRAEVTEVISPMGLRLSDEKTCVVHIDEGFDFLGTLSHPVADQEGVQQGVRLHVPFEEVVGFDQGEGEGDHQAGHEQPALRPPAPTQRRSARLDQLLPPRRVESDLRLPAPVHLGAGRRLASP